VAVPPLDPDVLTAIDPTAPAAQLTESLSRVSELSLHG
jgi:hypothetical protein